MNHLKYGSIAVGAPGSEMRLAAERTDRYAEFWRIYSLALQNAIQNHPNEYTWPESELNSVVHRIAIAYDNGSYNKDSRAFKTVCKHFGIKHTYQAIKKWIDTGELI